MCTCVRVCVCARQIHTHMSALPIHSKQNCQELKRERRRESHGPISWISHASALSTETHHGRGGERERERERKRGRASEPERERAKERKGEREMRQMPGDIHAYEYLQIELPAKLLDYFLRSNKRNINQTTCMYVCTHKHTPTHTYKYVQTHTHTHI